MATILIMRGRINFFFFNDGDEAPNGAMNETMQNAADKMGKAEKKSLRKFQIDQIICFYETFSCEMIL